MNRLSLILTALVLFAGCAESDNTTGSAASQTDNIAELARRYLVLELSMGRHDEGHVDAYFGSENLRDEAESAALDLAEIDAGADELGRQLIAWRDTAGNEPAKARINGLIARLTALRTRIALNSGDTFSFDEESRRLFGVAAPDHDEAYFQDILNDIDTLISGEGDLSTRVNDFTNQFVIPADKLAAVFDAAIDECRNRTLAHITLPDNESFSVEYVTDKSWSGYNWYQGNAQSLIQINTDLPIYISRAVDLGCHEGYPGHHTFNALLEKNLVNENGWLEFSLYPLFSPQSLIAEGSGNYGIDLAFPADERIAFEKNVLFPLAGLDSGQADQYYELQQLLGKLAYAGNEAARDYLNNEIDRDGAVQWLVRYALSSPERADQRVDFFDAYRSYVINYNLGKDMVQNFVENGTSTAAARWKKFEVLLSSPILPGDL